MMEHRYTSHTARWRRIAMWGANIGRTGMLCGTLALSTGTAFAQADQSSAQSDANAGIAEAEVIIVTARQKNETLTEVPAAITSYSSDFLAKQNITNFVDYATKVPNLSFQFGQGGTLLWSGDRETSIRGVVGIGTTAFYIDDTPIPSSVSPQVLNLDRIEVLKGPQGTLFGASSMGGNFRYITQKPSLTDNEGSVSLQGGHTKRGGFDYDGNVRTNVVLVPDQLSLSAAGGYMQDSGFITRRYPDVSGNLVTKNGDARSRNLSGTVALRAKFSDSLEATASVLGQSNRLHGFPGAYVRLPEYKVQSYTLDRDANVQEYSKDDWSLGALVLRYSGTGFNIVSSNSVFSRKITQVDDNTEGTNFFFESELGVSFDRVPFYNLIISRESRFAHETRLSFEKGALIEGLSGIVGVFHNRVKKNDFNPAVFVPELAEAGLEPSYLAEVRTNSIEKNTALFGELYYEPLSRLTFTLGLRKYWITQNRTGSVDTGALFGPEGSVNAPIANRESGLVPKAVVSYEIGDRGNIYASVSKGFRVGGTNGSLPSFCDTDLDNLGLTRAGAGRYRSDTLWSYEVGAKSRLASGQLNVSAAAFRMDWSNIQQIGTLPICGLTFTTNAGKARINGGEFEINGRPIADVPLTLQLGVGYLDATLVDPGFLPQAPNSPLGFVPKWTASLSGYYETPLSGSVDLFVAADYSYTSSTKVPSVADGTAVFFTRQPLNLVNANFGVKFGGAQLMVYAKNLLDKRLNYGDQPNSGFERRELLEDGSFERVLRGVVSRPRQIGVQYRMAI
ncbi:outer membrane receptor protein involved in Fe transport [Novosphingobium hassiacum]|uniref:Outer membrane receptor protein involved in Fe transport n=1 Tax=Novosphingobium hassiacum TaxID=173676 RepID=A0A7W5ZTR0_9SPHN|nr:TonB-dependent receptor [Novosphingobium hassiacum]MBB3859316.1 outer membrane receptor protein involved in Fe transport [Novosphingobium hassiacum]